MKSIFVLWLLGASLAVVSAQPVKDQEQRIQDAILGPDGPDYGENHAQRQKMLRWIQTPEGAAWYVRQRENYLANESAQGYRQRMPETHLPAMPDASKPVAPKDAKVVSIDIKGWAGEEILSRLGWSKLTPKEQQEWSEFVGWVSATVAGRQGKTVTVSPPVDPSKPLKITWIQADGSLVQLSDDSLWRSYRPDQFSHWAAGHQVAVLKEGGRVTITNLKSGSSGDFTAVEGRIPPGTPSVEYINSSDKMRDRLQRIIEEKERASEK